MTKNFVIPKNGPAPVGPYSPGVVANGFLFVSGQIPLNPATGQLVSDTFDNQVRQTLENLKTVLDSAGSSFNDVVKVTIFLSDLSNFDALNRIYGEYFGESKPARSTVQAARLPKDVAVEIEAIALAHPYHETIEETITPGRG